MSRRAHPAPVKAPSPETTLWMSCGLPVQVKRSAKRRTVALQVRPGQVTLYAPNRVPVQQLNDLLSQREGWVKQHLAQFAALPAAPSHYAAGSTLPFLGEQLTLEFTSNLKQPRREGATLFIPAGPADQVSIQVERWTYAACREPYRDLVQQYAKLLNAQQKLGKVSVSRAATRWGSCTSKGDIRLHWKLSRAPTAVLHYVALHEAAHLLELNHSARYWAHVQSVMPDWRTHRRWLKDHGNSL